VNQDILSGMWKQLKGEVRQNWGKLTDSDIDQINGSREKLVGMLQERYGWSKSKADEEVNNFLLKANANLNS
jgi:uncharacterized protein YjbJ (UPF0337 family)